MKNLHIPTILVTLGLVGLVAILSGQNMVAAPSVQVSNPLGVPGWVPSGVWMAAYQYHPAFGSTYQDYTVPAGHFALVRTGSGFTTYNSFSTTLGVVTVDDGTGFKNLTGWQSSGGDFDPGIEIGRAHV